MSFTQMTYDVSDIMHEDQDDFLSYLFGKNMTLDAIRISLPSFLQIGEDIDPLAEAEAEFEDFLSFIADFQAKTKA